MASAPGWTSATARLSATVMTMNGADGGLLAGPWVQGFWFEVPGPWVSKSNFRRSSGRKTSGRWDQAVGFETRVASLALAHRPAGWELGEAGQRVADRPAIVAFCYADSLLDVPNLSKSALDALERIVFHTDASVRHCATMGSRVTGDGLVAIARLDPQATAEAVLTAAAALATAALAAWDPPPTPSVPPPER